MHYLFTLTSICHSYVCICSEQKNVDNHGARGWGDAKTGSSKKKKPAAGGSVRFEGDDEHDEEEEEDEDEMTEIDSQFSDDDDYDYEDEEEGGDGRRTGKASSSSAPKGQYASAPIDDDRFDRMLEEEYDSEEVGDLEDEVGRLSLYASYTCDLT